MVHLSEHYFRITIYYWFKQRACLLFKFYLWKKFLKAKLKFFFGFIFLKVFFCITQVTFDIQMIQCTLKVIRQLHNFAIVFCCFSTWVLLFSHIYCISLTFSRVRFISTVHLCCSNFSLSQLLCAVFTPFHFSSFKMHLFLFNYQF